MAETLFRAVSDAARLTGTETLVGLYCGIGAIALYLAGDARRVFGLEASPGAVEDDRLPNAVGHFENNEVFRKRNLRP